MRANNPVPRDIGLQFLFRIIDFVCIIGSIFLILSYIKIPFSANYVSFVSVLSMLYFSFAELLGLYRFETYHLLKASYKTIILTWFSTFLTMLALGYIVDVLHVFSRDVIGLCFFITPLLFFIWRLFACKYQHYYFKDESVQRSFAIIGANTIGRHIAETIIKDISVGYKFLGFYDDRSEDDERISHNLKDYQHLGDFEQAVEDARAGKVDVFYIVLPMVAEYRIAKLLNKLGDATAEVNIVPNFFVYNLLHSRWHNVGSYLALSIYDTPFYGVGSIVKRAEDLVIGSLILLLISLPMLVIAILVKITSPGPVIFKQARYGLNGQKVIVWKFRSMTVCENQEDSIKQATKNDTRVTPLGKFLRKTSLDELPQFINVLQGTMSIVGPRPHAVAHNEMYRKEIDGYMLHHMVKPGITGLAQINGLRGETKDIQQMKERIEYDLNYIRSWSLSLDIKIIFLTIFKGFVNKNAY